MFSLAIFPFVVSDTPQPSCGILRHESKPSGKQMLLTICRWSPRLLSSPNICYQLRELPPWRYVIYHSW
ncbi:hypothetical protein WAI453_007594 [Rhynchosporium graminicola]